MEGGTGIAFAINRDGDLAGSLTDLGHELPLLWIQGVPTVLPRLTDAAVEYVTNSSKDKPFFLYVPLASPHTPIAPTAEWQGKSGLNPYADFVMQTDHCIGE